MRRGLTAALLAAVVAAGCTHDRTREGRIVFQSSRSGQWELYSARPDGSDLRSLSYGLDDHLGGFAFFWSPGGERVFVPVERANGGHALLIDTRTRDRRRVPVHALGGVSWSPDAQRMAVAAERGIVVLDADGSNRRQLTHDSLDSFPAWSPDGERIAFASGRDVFTVAVSGGPPDHVVRLQDEDAFGLAWSSDGGWIAFSRPDYGTAFAPLEVVRPDGSGRRRLTLNGEDASWSPRAQTLVYVHWGDVYRVDADGRNKKRLTFDGRGWTVERSPIWSPDGTRIAYVRPRLARGIRDPQTPTDVWVMNADGSGKRPVTRAFPTGGSSMVPEWVAGQPKATPVRSSLRLVSLPQRHVLRTRQPVGGLAAEGSRAVVVQGLGSATEFDNPPGPLVVWDAVVPRTTRIPVRGCGTALRPALAGNPSRMSATTPLSTRSTATSASGR